MRVVITGASGFLGQALLAGLGEAGISCVGLSRREIPGLLRVPSYAEAPQGDLLIHLAEANDRGWVNAQGDAYEETSQRTLRALLDKGYQRVIYASSAVLYGDRDGSPRRTSDPVHIHDRYARIKQASEQQVLATGGTVARLTNLYGPGMSSSNVLSAILQQLHRTGPLTLQDTSPVRDFLWVGDAASALVHMIRSPVAGIFNVGSGVGTSIRELATLVLEAAGQPDRPLVSLRSGTPPSSLVVDITETLSAFGWRPSVALREGLRQLVTLTMESEPA